MVSFFTLRYREVVKELISSLEKFQLSYDVEETIDRGNWLENTAYKPTFILDKLRQHKRPVVWIDADAVVVRYPSYFDIIEEDLAFYSENNLKARAGTIFFNYTPEAIKVIEGWQKLSRDTQIGEQKHFENVVNSLFVTKSATVFLLPESYCQIFDFKHWGEPVIIHNQASRRFRK